MQWNFWDIVADDLYVDLNRKYKKLLLEKSINKSGSQRELAKIMSICRPTVSNWKNNTAVSPFV